MHCACAAHAVPAAVAAQFLEFWMLAFVHTDVFVWHTPLASEEADGIAHHWQPLPAPEASPPPRQLPHVVSPLRAGRGGCGVSGREARGGGMAATAREDAHSVCHSRAQVLRRGASQRKHQAHTAQQQHSGSNGAETRVLLHSRRRSLHKLPEGVSPS